MEGARDYKLNIYNVNCIQEKHNKNQIILKKIDPKSPNFVIVIRNSLGESPNLESFLNKIFSTF